MTVALVDGAVLASITQHQLNPECGARIDTFTRRLLPVGKALIHERAS